ncbi:OsmC family protein [Halobacterium sp. KA-6]|uniref:OsmC family protein n=1 Tax=Halobacterium sp. KA-6 TaxID=2896368 RepID=UPI001E2DC0F9|nr:OsmC family protein [Halobacterium sp. KA-6]MCD2205010.1 OsmC family protein [Halobacterium sp. KA-6]
MTIEVTSTSEEGYVTRSRVGDYELTVDATEEEGPEPNGVLLADYASCFIPAFRVGGNKEGFDDLGRIDVDVEGDLDDEDDLEAIRFHILVEEDLDDDDFDAIVARAEDICHVHSALREGLHAEITGETGAF